MLVFKDLTPFFRALFRYIGNGYTDCQVSFIKQNKRQEYFLKRTDNKLTKKYLTNLTQGQRQYRRKKGLCNYQVFRYRDLLYIVLKSPGIEELGEKWTCIYKQNLKLGEVLEVQIYIDERNKNTIKLTKNLLKDIKSKICLSIEKRKGYEFHSHLKKLNNLAKVLPYRGLNMQLSGLLRDINKWQKQHGTKWNVPKFFN